MNMHLTVLGSSFPHTDYEHGQTQHIETLEYKG